MFITRNCRYDLGRTEESRGCKGSETIGGTRRHDSTAQIEATVSLPHFPCTGLSIGYIPETVRLLVGGGSSKEVLATTAQILGDGLLRGCVFRRQNNTGVVEVILPDEFGRQGAPKWFIFSQPS